MRTYKPFFIATPVILLGLFALSFLMYSPASDATPAVSWSTGHVYQFLAPGGEASVTVTLSLDPSYKAKGPLSLSLTPSLTPYLSIAESITEAPQQTFTLTIAIPDATGYGVIDGTLHVRSGKSTVAKPLPITLEINELGIPPDPGEAGLQTIAGIDLDADGVRDDVQRWIALTYPESEKMRAAVTQRVIDMQEAILNTDNRDLSIQIAHNGGRSIECLHYTNPGGASEIIAQAKAHVLNTKERSLAYIAYNNHLGGQVFHQRRLDEWKTSCSFDVDAMED